MEAATWPDCVSSGLPHKSSGLILAQTMVRGGGRTRRGAATWPDCVCSGLPHESSGLILAQQRGKEGGGGRGIAAATWLNWSSS